MGGVMEIDATSSKKGERYKGKGKTKKPIKKYPKNVNQVKTNPPRGDEGSSKELEEESIQYSMEERAQSDVRENTVSEEKKELHSVNESAKGKVVAAGVASEEKIQASDHEDLEKSEEKISVPSLMEMLKHKNEKVRIETLESLLKIGDRSVCYAFASCMKDESFKVRLGAMRGLYKFGGDLAVDYLITALEDTHPDVRRRAVIYLGWLRKKELVPYITGALADSSPLVRKVATYTSGDLKDLSAVPHLIKALDDTDLEVKKGALTALKRITKKSFDSDPSSPGKIHPETVVKWKEWWKSEKK